MYIGKTDLMVSISCFSRRFKRSALENYDGWKVEPTMYVCTMYYEGLWTGRDVEERHSLMIYSHLI